MDLKRIFQHAVKSVHPEQLIRNAVKITTTPRGRHLVVNSTEFQVNRQSIHIVGFGKAVQSMALTLEEIIGSDMAEGIVTIPTGSKINHPTKIRFIEGAKNNLPDQSAMEGALEIKRLVTRLQSDDLIVVLISGGGSALLPLPTPGVTLEEKVLLTKQLANAGANITELNTVRKKISVLKGGGLAKYAHPCRVVSLILSDVIGDELDFIASGPTCINPDDSLAAKRVLDKYNLFHKQSEVIRCCVTSEINSPQVTMKHVTNFLIGSNKIATQSARLKALELGYDNSLVISNEISGDVKNVANLYAELSKIAALVINKQLKLEQLLQFIRNNFNTNTILLQQKITSSQRFCFIFGGETTVVVHGDGLGGRNQQLSLEFASTINTHSEEFQKTGVDVQFLSAGTDGFDGPTIAAGALVDSRDLIKLATEQGLNPEEELCGNNSYGFFKKYKNGECLIETGHTGTNVMDLHLLVVYKTGNEKLLLQ